MSDIDPTMGLVLVAVFAAFALALSSFALWLAVSARHDAREALDAVRAVAAKLPRADARKRPVPEVPASRVERRERDLGPPDGQPERRRHRAPDATRARRRDEDDPQWKVAEPGTTAMPAAPGQLATVEQAAPDQRFRRPPPPLPRPGAIGQPQ